MAEKVKTGWCFAHLHWDVGRTLEEFVNHWPAACDLLD